MSSLSPTSTSSPPLSPSSSSSLSPSSYTDLLQSSIPFIDEPSSLLLSFAARNLPQQQQQEDGEGQHMGINSQLIVLEKEFTSTDPSQFTLRHIRKTEVQEETLNPDFITTISIPFRPTDTDTPSPLAQQLRLELYHIHNETSRTCLGYVDVTLSQLISVGALTLPMEGSSHVENPTLIHVMIVDQKPEAVAAGDAPHLITKPVRIERHYPGRTLVDDDEEIRIENDTVGWCYWCVLKLFQFICILMYTFLTLSAFQLWDTAPDTWELIPIVIMLGTNAIHATFKLMGVTAYDVIQELLEDAILPCCIALPFSFARRFEVPNGFFLVRPQLLHSAQAILVICGLYQSLSTCCRRSPSSSITSTSTTTTSSSTSASTSTSTSTSDSPLASSSPSSLDLHIRVGSFHQFSFARNVSEVVLGFIVVGLSFVLWTTYRFRQLMFGGISLIIALVLQDSYLDLGRLMFYTSLLLTEQHLRIPNQYWLS